MTDSDNMSWNSADEAEALALPPLAPSTSSAPIPTPRPAQVEIPREAQPEAPNVPQVRAGLMDALERGVRQMSPRREELVNFDSSEDERGLGPEFEDEPLEAQTEAHRRAVQSHELRKDQDQYKKELMEGAPPARFIEIFPLLDSIRQHCIRDSIAKRYADTIESAARDLIKINTALKTELDPVSNKFKINTTII